MGNYDDIRKTLSEVLETQLLSNSINALATELGYAESSRSSLSRIKRGEAGEDAIDALLSRLNEYLRIDIPTLLRMEAAIKNEKDFSRLIKPEMVLHHKDWVFHAIYPFIAHDYSHFSPEFRNGELLKVLNLERTDPRAFFNMLAYFYIIKSNVKFYKRNTPHKIRCATVIEPLGQKLIDIFPSNGMAAGIALSYSISDTYNAEAPILWSLVETMGSMLQAFASPIDTNEKDCVYMQLPGLPARAYWKGKDDEKILMTWFRPAKAPSTGHYELFSINRSSRDIQCIASLFFMSESIMSVYPKDTRRSQLGVYNMLGDTINFEWEHPEDDPMHAGNTWELRSLETSQSLRELDRSITDDALTREMARSEGLEVDFAMQPEDVTISIDQLTLTLKNGSRYSIDIDKAPFLAKLTPKEEIMVCRQISDERIFVIWPAIRQSIPLELFGEQARKD